MTKKKLPRDPNQRAKAILDIATGETRQVADTRNPAAVALGSMGGKTRAKNLSPTKRKAIAKKAAKARWDNRPSK
jgi:hypothetical protein